MEDSRGWLEKFLSLKLNKEREEKLWKQTPFRELDEKYLKQLRKRGYKGIPPNQKSKNFMVLKLFSHVPEFKKDITKVRNELGIPEGGFESQWDMEQWTNRNDTVDRQGDFSEEDSNVGGDFPSSPFEKKMMKLGTKYRLPFNFYASPYRGLPVFVLTDRIVPPESNYDISFHFNPGGNQLLWTSLIAYAPLSKKELDNATSSLRETQLKLTPQFFKNSDIFAKKYYRDNIYRDLAVLDEQIKRLSKPKKVKKYMEGGYLSRLKKNKDVSDKEIKKWEPKHKENVIAVFDNPTSTQIGEKQGMSGDSVRQAKVRLNKLAQELFGYGLEP